MGCHFLLQRDLPDPRIKATFPVSPALQADSLPPSVDVQSLSCVQLFATLWTVACQTPVSFTISWSLLKLMSIELVMSSNHLILCCPLLLPSVFSASGTFLMNRLFASGGQSIGASALVHLMDILDSFPLGLTSLISLQSKGLSRVFFNTMAQKHQVFIIQPSLQSNFHIHT